MWSISVLKLVRATCLVSFATACVMGAGCSQSPASVSGKVTFKDAPLKGGFVTFISTEGYRSNSGTINEDGTYTIPNLNAGAYQVTVDTESLRPSAGGMGYKGSGGMSGPAPVSRGGPAKPLDADTKVPAGYAPSNPAESAAVKNANKYIQIPDSYRNADTSGLTYKLTGGANSIDLVLK